MLGEDFSITKLAVPGVSVLIAFLAYTSQYFFLHFESAPLTRDETWKINIFALCIWICYYRTCFVDPGRLPKAEERPKPKEQEGEALASRQRWCRRCEAYKPPRAHHCKTCKRCIPKMDHHCPWTSNCVSHFTLPHFIRFLFYATIGMSYLETLLWHRASFVWKNSHLPSYLGPTLGQLIHLFILLVVNSLTAFGLFVLLLRSLWSIGSNTTTIETWEIERHATLVRRARVLGGYLEGPGGIRVHIKKQEYPYDIGIWANIKQSMGGSANFLSWFWPLAATPDRRTGWEFETNDFEDPGVSWPPPDPDRIPIPASARPPGNISMPTYATIQDEIDAFNRRKEEDMKRFQKIPGLQRRKPFHDRYKKGENARGDSDESEPDYGDDLEGEEAWRNAEGERLRDFGVDEEVEFYDEEDIPLAVLIERRKQQQSANCSLSDENLRNH
ncbi:Palmitoyltransferase pfa4 [Penicillium digitatum]|uniref:Palmitoyltransferase PFA4 n=1 Tax=Penicillium digitatum TaxID=36651 RepID=A0A7T7BPZ6_PENDI|nr:Palmitoyltransferase pfa4 [Penicillium digitatum]